MNKILVEKRVSYDDIPFVMAELVDQVKLLNDKISKMEAVQNDPAGTKRRLLTTHQLSRLLNRSRATIYRMVARGQIPCIKHGKSLSFYEDEIMDWINGYRKLSDTEMMNVAKNYMR